MRKHKILTLLSILFFLGLPYWAQVGWSANPMAVKSLKGKKKSEAKEEVQLPKNLSGDQIDGFMATLSDQQTRRLLIEELKKRAEEQTVAAEAGEQARCDSSSTRPIAQQLRSSSGLRESFAGRLRSCPNLARSSQYYPTTREPFLYS